MSDYADLIRRAAAWLWTDPAVDPSTERVTLLRSGNDPLDLLPPALPRPATGTFLGYTTGGVTEDWGVEYEYLGGDGYSPPTHVRVGKQTPQVEAELVFTGYRQARELLEPPGVVGLTQRSFGGGGTVATHSLFVLVGAWQELDVVWECRLYYRGVFEPSPLVTGRQFQPLRLVFRPLAGLSATGGCRPPGDQIARTWWVRVAADGTNTLTDPRRTTPLEDEVVGLRRGDSLHGWF